MDVGGLTPDIPLGPFEGALITAYAAASRTARLHARRDCRQLRTDQIRTLTVPLNAAMLTRMCDHCAMFGRWARPATALSIFLKVFFGYGLTYQLNAYTEPDSDDAVTDEEIADTAALLRTQETSPSDEDETDWGAVGRARDLRDKRVIPAWCGAAESLMEAAGTIARYPWLRPWASKRLSLKAQYAEALRQQAARLLNSEALIVAAVVDQMPQPAMPTSDPAFAVLGTTSEVQRALESFWRYWHSEVCSGWLMPQEYSYLGHELDNRLANKRKGRDKLRDRARVLLDDWACRAMAEAAHRKCDADRLIFATVQAKKTNDGGQLELEQELNKWELGTLVVFTVAADWANRTFLLRVPGVVAKCLLTESLTLTCAECPGAPEDVSAYAALLAAWAQARETEAGHGAFLPGTLDDMPVAERRPVTLAEVRALRRALDDGRQLFVVFSISNGVEVLPLDRVEKRCKDGWTGVLLAEAGDLPAKLIEPCLEEAKAIADADEDDAAALEPRWQVRSRTPEHPGFGEHLGTEDGVRDLCHMLSLRDDDRELERSLRVLAVLRGVHDLREVGESHDPRTQSVPWVVWSALLAPGDLDLQPFRPPNPDAPLDAGLGLPLGVLADVQIYTTNADPRIDGKGHSPFCTHAHERGITRDYSLLTLTDLTRRSVFGWCSKCGGFAVRRLTDAQVAYYRAAHRLCDIDQQLTSVLTGRSRPNTEVSATIAILNEIDQWLNDHDEWWKTGDIWQIQGVLKDLKEKAEQFGRYQPEGTNVIHLDTKR